MRKFILSLLTLFSFGLFSGSSFADWQLDNNKSRLNFVSVKKAAIAENHQFTVLKGKIDKRGKVQVNIDLTSVDTSIAIRDERMKKFVFETEKYSSALFNAQLDNNMLTELKMGDSKTISVNGVLNFHGQSQNITLEVKVSKLNNSTLLVATLQPFFIKADAYGIVAGINKLKELASLPSIDYVVPVSFSVTFTR